MNRKLKFILLMLLLACIGGVFGYLVGNYQNVISTAKDLQMGIVYPFDILQLGLAGASAFYMIRLIRGFVRFSNASREPHPETGYSDAERINGAMIVNSVLLSSITYLWLFSGFAMSLGGVGETNSQQYWIDAMFTLGVLVTIIATIVQMRIIKRYNTLFPKRNYDYYSMNAKTEFLDKLDEAEKAVAYRSGFVAFRETYFASMLGFVVVAIYSILFQTQLFAIFVTGSVLFYSQFVYLKETKKTMGM